MREVKVFQASSAKQTPDGATASDNKLYAARLQVDDSIACGLKPGLSFAFSQYLLFCCSALKASGQEFVQAGLRQGWLAARCWLFEGINTK